MSLVPDCYVFAPQTVAETTPIITRHLPGAEVTSECFDAYVAWRHGPDVRVGAALAYRIARDLRGGREVDRSAPADWHVRSIEPSIDVDWAPGREASRRTVGTEIWFSRSYAPPEGYDERGPDVDVVPPPGRAAVLAA
jgi:hypothetical protein